MYKNPYEAPHPEPKLAEAWDRGWCAAYDTLEEEWCRKVLPIVGELEESIRYDWEHNDCVQVSKLKLIFDTFYPYVPDHDWLEPLVKDAVAVQNESGWALTLGEFLDLQLMAHAFGVVLEDNSL